MNSPWEPKIVAFLCHWCSYAGADLAGVSRIQYPPEYPGCAKYRVQGVLTLCTF